MTTLVLNQQIGTMNNKGLSLTKVCFILLPFIATAAVYTLGFKSIAIQVFVAVSLLCIAFGFALTGKGTDAHSDNYLFKGLEEDKVFDMNEAKMLLKKHNAEIYRIDSRKHMIQFFIKEKKYTMRIKPKD